MSRYQRSFISQPPVRAVAIRVMVCPECLSPDLQVDRKGKASCRQCGEKVEKKP
jgi:ribosomal protein L37AE/L43A